MLYSYAEEAEGPSPVYAQQPVVYVTQQVSIYSAQID